MGRSGRLKMTPAYIREARRAQEEAESRAAIAREAAEIEAENDGMRRCMVLEGEKSFYKWWDDDENVPPLGSRRERIELLEKRIKELEHAATVHPVTESV